MKYADAKKQLEGYRRQIVGIRQKMRKTQANAKPERVTDYALSGAKGVVKLSTVFGEKSDLIVIHNMGAKCSYCTLWADGFNGVYPHLADRAAFVVVSPDAPALQAKFAKSRGWRFPMLSHAGTTFAADMGYVGASGGFTPGVSVFQKSKSGVVRVSDTTLGPGDDFCSVWHLFDLIPEGHGGWRPKFKYPAA